MEVKEEEGGEGIMLNYMNTECCKCVLTNINLAIVYIYIYISVCVCVCVCVCVKFIQVQWSRGLRRDT